MSEDIMQLKKGDLIYAIAPGYPFDEQILEQATRVVESYGLRLVVPAKTLKPSFFHAQSDPIRLSLLLDGILQSKYKAIWAIRGGYGSNRLISGLLSNKVKLLKSEPKLLLGLSDVTSLLYFWTHHLKWVAWHSPVLEAFSRAEFGTKQRDSLFEALYGECSETLLKVKVFNSPKTKKLHPIHSKLGVMGGNLTTLQSHIGTPLKINFKNRVVFLEDVGERGYRIDRMLYHLQEAGVFKGAKAILLGEFTGGQESDGQSRIDEALLRFAKSMDPLPIFYGIPSGHGNGYQVIPMGTSTLIDQDFLKIKYFKK